jgi:anti-anti-sigma factor
MHKQISSRLRDVRRYRLADKWVRETEDFLKTNREDPSKAWPAKTNPHVCDMHRSVAGKESVSGSEVIDARPAPNGTWLVSLQSDEQGHLDADGAQGVADQLDDFMATHRPDRVIMDLSPIESCTADFVQVVTDVCKRITRQNGRVALCQARPGCAALLETSGLPEIVDCYGSVEQALNAVTAQ